MNNPEARTKRPRTPHRKHAETPRRFRCVSLPPLGNPVALRSNFRCPSRIGKPVALRSNLCCPSLFGKLVALRSNPLLPLYVKKRMSARSQVTSENSVPSTATTRMTFFTWAARTYTTPTGDHQLGPGRRTRRCSVSALHAPRKCGS